MINDNNYVPAKLIMSGEAFEKSVKWYLTHYCPKWDKETKKAEKNNNPLVSPRCGVVGYLLHYEFHGSSIGSMVTAVCQMCGSKLKDVNDDVSRF